MDTRLPITTMIINFQRYDCTQKHKQKQNEHETNSTLLSSRCSLWLTSPFTRISRSLHARRERRRRSPFPPIGDDSGNAPALRRQKRMVSFRAAIIAKATPQKRAPRSPTRGSSLAVFGSFEGAASAWAVSVPADAAGVITMRIGTPG